jgi:integrase
MARARNKLTARSAAALSAPGRYSDGGSLYLVIDGQGEAVRRRWLFLFNWNGKRREMGLGSAAVTNRSKGELATSLAEARQARDVAERLVRDSKDPIAARDLARQEQAGRPTFGEIADAFVEDKGPEWRNEKHKAQWTMTLTAYCEPIRKKPVDEIDTDAVLEVLRPIWQEKPETASRLRGRIEAVLDAARAKGHIPRNEANPARWRGHLDKLLAKRQKLTRGHHAAMDYAAVPAFIGQLRERAATAALALEFTILTATRSGEMRGAQWHELDLEKKVWVVPPTRMKAGREHRIPLCDRAVEIVKAMSEAKTGDFVFPGSDGKRQLSIMAMDMLLRRMKVDITVHGFRSAFRDWAGNETEFAREIAEAALSHVIGDKAEQAYRRGDALEKRRALMDAWAKYCEPKGKESGGNPVA